MTEFSYANQYIGDRLGLASILSPDAFALGYAPLRHMSWGSHVRPDFHARIYWHRGPACRKVQVHVTSGAVAFAIVGLPDKAVAESRERVRNAPHAVGLGLPYKHITVNLAPADLPKE